MAAMSVASLGRVEPGPGQESVWDYPRPPRVEPFRKHIQVVVNEIVVADSRRALRVLETSHPPVYYLPPQDVRLDLFVPTGRVTSCEFKGWARYYTLRVGVRTERDVAWSYPEPAPGYEAIAGYLALYPTVCRARRTSSTVLAESGSLAALGGVSSPSSRGARARSACPSASWIWTGTRIA